MKSGAVATRGSFAFASRTVKSAIFAQLKRVHGETWRLVIRLSVQSGILKRKSCEAHGARRGRGVVHKRTHQAESLP